MIGFMFGVWYLAIAVGQKAAGTMGGMIDKISEEYSMGTFFLIFTLIPIGVGIISILLNPYKKILDKLCKNTDLLKLLLIKVFF
jgi:POT family proton-dependent oligopeptide transporter